MPPYISFVCLCIAACVHKLFYLKESLKIRDFQAASFVFLAAARNFACGKTTKRRMRGGTFFLTEKWL